MTDITSMIGIDIAGPGLIGFLVGFGIKKIGKIIFWGAAVVTALIFTGAAYLANQGIITVNQDALSTLLANWGNTLATWISGIGGSLAQQLGTLGLQGTSFGAAALFGLAKG